MRYSKALVLDQDLVNDLILDFSLLALITFLWLQ